MSAHNCFDSLQTFDLGNGNEGQFYSLPALEAAGLGNISRMPVCLRIVLESVLRNVDGTKVTEDNVCELAAWQPKADRTAEIPFLVSRIVLQDFTGVPLLVDLAAMRSAVARLGKDPKLIEPLVPVDLVVDHIQDGTNSPYIYSDTASGTWPQPADDELNRVPVGTGPMAYGNGRLWVAQGRNFVAGDILGGTEGILKFTENTYLNGGGSFTVSVGSGDITAMRFVAAPNTSLGVGELMVFTSDAAFSVSVPADRNDWYSLADPIQRVVLINNGSSSQFSTELVNGDCLFRSRDGIRSLIQAVRDFSQQGNTPISREMSRILKYDNPAYLPYQSGVLFNNRYLLTSMDNYKAATGVAYKGLTVLDFDLISGLSGKAPAAYDGFWKLEMERGDPAVLTGFDIYQLAKGRFSEVERCFAFVRNESEALEIWELKNDGDHIEDKDYSSGDAVFQKISSEIELPSFDFGQIGAAKELASADMWVDEVSGGRVDFHCDFHPDQYPCWINWQDWYVIAEYQASDCESLVDYQKQYRPRMRIGRPPDTEEPAAGKRMNYGWEFAARVKWKGHARLKMFRINALETQEEPYADVNIDSTAKAIACDCLSRTSSATNQ